MTLQLFGKCLYSKLWITFSSIVYVIVFKVKQTQVCIMTALFNNYKIGPYNELFLVSVFLSTKLDDHIHSIGLLLGLNEKNYLQYLVQCQIHSGESIYKNSFLSFTELSSFYGVCIFLLPKVLFLRPLLVLKFYDSVIKPIFYIGSIPLYDALLSSKYNQLEEKGTDLAESHARMTTVLYYKVKWFRVTTAGNNLLYSFAKW